MKVVILTPLMTEKNEDSSVIAEVETEEKKNFKDVIPEKVKHPSTWITAGLVVFYLFLLGFLDLVLWIIAGMQFLFTLFTLEPNSHLSTFSIKLRNYIVQIVDFVTYSSQERPFPFNPLPEEDND